MNYGYIELNNRKYKVYSSTKGYYVLVQGKRKYIDKVTTNKDKVTTNKDKVTTNKEKVTTNKDKVTTNKVAKNKNTDTFEQSLEQLILNTLLKYGKKTSYGEYTLDIFDLDQRKVPVSKLVLVDNTKEVYLDTLQKHNDMKVIRPAKNIIPMEEFQYTILENESIQEEFMNNVTNMMNRINKLNTKQPIRELILKGIEEGLTPAFIMSNNSAYFKGNSQENYNNFLKYIDIKKKTIYVGYYA